MNNSSFNKNVSIAIIGGGPAGVLAAISAAEKGARVTIYEHKEALLKKLLITGNGKCNITNMNVTSRVYHSDSLGDATCDENCTDHSCDVFFTPELLLNKYSPKMLCDYLEHLGLLVRYKNELVYPYSEQASAVRNVLITNIKRLGIQVKLGVDIYKQLKVLESDSSGLSRRFCIGNEVYDRLILACGGKSYKETGSDGSGLEIAKKLGHSITRLRPSLVKLKTSLPHFEMLKGIRMKGKVSYGNVEEYGEIQFTQDGVSGICIFQLSGIIVDDLNSKKVTISINLLPEYSYDEFCKLIADGAIGRDKDSIDVNSLIGILPDKLADYIFLEKKHLDVKTLYSQITNMQIPIIGTDSLEHAQVTRGGVVLNEINADLSSKLVDGLYFAGEMLDVDGPCGGYNLHFALTSGMLSGESAAI